MILIVGLGNPGKKYEKTRHNIGSMVVDKFSRENDFPNWKESKNNNCLYTKKEITGKEIELIKPLVFMNNSGQVVKSVSIKHNLKPENILVIHDDIDLPLGRIRIVKNRGAAGHKGVESIIKELGSKNFVRLRVGIRPLKIKKVKNPENFVLQRFNKEGGEVIDEIIQKTIQAIEETLKENLDKVMQKYNK